MFCACFTCKTEMICQGLGALANKLFVRRWSYSIRTPLGIDTFHTQQRTPHPRSSICALPLSLPSISCVSPLNRKCATYAKLDRWWHPLTPCSFNPHNPADPSSYSTRISLRAIVLSLQPFAELPTLFSLSNIHSCEKPTPKCAHYFV